MKDFFTDFRATSQDILEYVGQEVALKDVGKDSKSMFCEYRDRFTMICKKNKDSGGSGRVDVEISWGGSEGTTLSVTGTGEVHDDKGNSVEISATQNDNGTGTVSISGDHGSQR